MSLLGSTVRDSISGFEGIVIGEAQYLYESPSAQVQPRGLNNCQPVPAAWIETERLVIIERKDCVGFMLHRQEA